MWYVIGSRPGGTSTKVFFLPQSPSCLDYNWCPIKLMSNSQNVVRHWLEAWGYKYESFLPGVQLYPKDTQRAYSSCISHSNECILSHSNAPLLKRPSYKSEYELNQRGPLGRTMLIADKATLYKYVQLLLIIIISYH